MIIKDNRGIVGLLMLFLMLAILPFTPFITDIGYLYGAKMYTQNKLTVSLRAAAHQLDRNALADTNNPKIYIKPNESQQQFLTYLKDNLYLDASLNPLGNSIADGQVSIEYFRVVNESDLPFTFTHDGYTETITKPSVAAIIKVPVKLFFKPLISAGDITDVYVHATVAPEIVSKHFDEW